MVVSFSVKILLLLAAAATSTVDSFVVVPRGNSVHQSATGLNGFGDAFKGAFANEEMGKRKNEGLSGGPNYNDNVTVNGKAVQGAVVGQKITVVAGRARVKIPVNCQKGDCGTCMVSMNGRKVKACQTPLPSGKCTVKTL